MIEYDFDISFISDLALREKQIQQNFRPIIAVHKWFARRPGTLFRGLLLSEFSAKPLKDAFYESHNFSGYKIADPFMGGGTPLFEANRLGCDTIGIDINPMSYWVVKQEIEHLDLQAYDQASRQLRQTLTEEIGHLYRTRCRVCDSTQAHVKYFLWIKVKNCSSCKKDFDLFPGYLIAKNARHPKNVFICPGCGHLTESENREHPGKCCHCDTQLTLKGPAKRSRCICPHCETINIFPDPKAGPPRHRLFAIEYHCKSCKPKHTGRFFKKPDEHDLEMVQEAKSTLSQMDPDFIPNDEILGGDETDRLHRWGYRHYREMFNPRQLLGLELSARLIAKVGKKRIRNALATNLSDLLRYQNMLCRYDTMALKSLDIFSVHGFPVGLVQCESNILGITAPKKNMCIGSGGWANIINKFYKAKSYCDAPFEVRYRGRKKEIVPIKGEWIGDSPNGVHLGKPRKLGIYCDNASSVDIEAHSLDAVLTDPPYFGNVQYAELMDFCYVWLRRLVGESSAAFKAHTTRNPDELTGNVNMGRGLTHFTEGLSAVFRQMARALKPGAPLAFTYHHNDIKAYYPAAIAILDAGLTCSASLPCPAEMGASIHIKGTGSSIIDTVFVCRATGKVPRNWISATPAGVADLVKSNLDSLEVGNFRASQGDTRCIAYGHLIRLAIWNLRAEWDKKLTTEKRLAKVANWIERFGGWSEVKKSLESAEDTINFQSHLMVRESNTEYGASYADISF
jgi:adenine-specific DNA methylase